MIGPRLKPPTGRPGLAALIRKELADQFGAMRLALFTALIFMAALIGAFLAGAGVKGLFADGLGQALAGRGFIMLFSASAGGVPILILLAVCGPVACTLLTLTALRIVLSA